MGEFKKWLEAIEEMQPRLNGPEYANKGIDSKIAANDKKTLKKPTKNPDALFGFKTVGKLYS